jgi:hypothetical protein
MNEVRSVDIGEVGGPIEIEAVGLPVPEALGADPGRCSQPAAPASGTTPHGDRRVEELRRD